jgi:uncharacterized RDD family membrane protein YckC
VNNPYAAPRARVEDVADPQAQVAYAGFWVRVGAAIIDSILMMIIFIPLLMWIYGGAELLQRAQTGEFGATYYLITYVLPAAAVIAFWIARQATPGKMALSLRIVDAKTLGPLSKGQAIGRYLAYYLSSIPLGLGLLWVAFDGRKQGWHDKLAGTYVVRN